MRRLIIVGAVLVGGLLTGTAAVVSLDPGPGANVLVFDAVRTPASAGARTAATAASAAGLGTVGVLVGVAIGVVALALASLVLWRTRGSR